MLKKINTLSPFFDDCYRRINVREFAKIKNISPPTASKLLEEYRKEKILSKEEDKRYYYYFANKESKLFVNLSRLYWEKQLKNSGLLDFIEKEFLNPIIILFGSLSKGETKKDSDIDIAIFTVSNKDIDFSKYERKLNRIIQVLRFKDRNSVENIQLLNNILNGYILRGSW